MWRGELRRQPHGFQVDLIDSIPRVDSKRFDGALVGQRGLDDPRVVEQHIEGADALRGARDHRFDLCGVAEVDLDRLGAGADFPDPWYITTCQELKSVW